MYCVEYGCYSKQTKGPFLLVCPFIRRDNAEGKYEVWCDLTIECIFKEKWKKFLTWCCRIHLSVKIKGIHNLKK